MTSSRSAILGVLLAGGRSRRMAVADKCLVDLGGRPLLTHTIERLRWQVGALVLNGNGDPVRFAQFGLPVVQDSVSGHPGPLAGILAGMLWAQERMPGIGLVATVATDTPFFPLDLVSRLSAALTPDYELAIARSSGRDHPVFGLFPVNLAPDLAEFLAQSPTRAAMAWVDRHRWIPVDFPVQPGAADPFFNINRPEDLEAAEARLGRGALREP